MCPVRSRALALIVLIGAAACEPGREAAREPARLAHAAYVWQRHWTAPVREAVAGAPAALDGLRVLVAEVDADGADGADGAAMTVVPASGAALAAARRPITLVVRINGARPIEGLSLAPVVRAGEALRADGVEVAGIEVDHDCATARLGDYARWLRAQRGALDPARAWRFSITALPAWAGGAGLGEVARAVDELVVQVHAVRAPVIFDAGQAWHDLARFARAVTATPLRVALPTYSAVVRGVEVGVDPGDVAAFVRRLEARPVAGVGGVVWFRLPVAGDEQTWSAATFARVLAPARAGGPPRPSVTLVAHGPDRFDVVVVNPSDEPVDLPPVRVAGAITAADMVAGYRARGPGRWDAPRRALAAKERIVIGWIHGEDVTLVD